MLYLMGRRIETDSLHPNPIYTIIFLNAVLNILVSATFSFVLFQNMVCFVHGTFRKRTYQITGFLLKVVTNEKGEALGEVLTIIC
jgi:hypothetical protein